MGDGESGEIVKIEIKNVDIGWKIGDLRVFLRIGRKGNIEIRNIEK